jgi:hypothetical protein
MAEIQLETRSDNKQDTSPRPFSEIPGLWLKVFRMTEAFLAQEAPRASGTNTLIGVVIYAVAAATATAVFALVTAGQEIPGLTPETMGVYVTVNGQILLLPTVLLGLVALPLVFYLPYLAARIVGGTGTFIPQAYLMSLFFVPLGIIMAAAALIPYAGSLIAAAVGIYMFILEVRTIKVVHRLTTGQAIGAMILMSVVAGLIMCIAMSLLAGTLSEGGIGSSFPPANQAVEHFNRGIDYQNQGQLDQAISEYGQAVALDPKMAEAYNNRGAVYAAQGDYQQALRDCDQVITLDPALALAFQTRGLAYQAQGKFQLALADFD